MFFSQKANQARQETDYKLQEAHRKLGFDVGAAAGGPSPFTTISHRRRRHYSLQFVVS